MWTIGGTIILIIYILNKNENINKDKSKLEENIEQKEKILQEREEAIEEIQTKRMADDKLLENIRSSLTSFCDLLQKQIERAEILSENKNDKVTDYSNDKLNKIMELRNTIVVEFDDEIKNINININIVARMITNISGSSKNVNNMLGDLLKSSSSIEKSVKEIQNISNETNILALNASIEAARAGENGLGFSVVSKEIRKLSEQTKGASSRIQEVVSGIQTKMRNAVEIKNKGGDIVGECTIKSEEIVENFKLIDRDMGEFFEWLTNILNPKKLDLVVEENKSNEVKVKEADYIQLSNELKSIHSLAEKTVKEIEFMSF